MDKVNRVSEYYDNEWDIAGREPETSSRFGPPGDRIARETDEYNRSIVFLASLRAWISGYLSH
jgi:hypothetical protein